MMLKWFGGIALGGAILLGCSDTESFTDEFAAENSTKSDSSLVDVRVKSGSLWQKIEEQGVAEYFEGAAAEGKFTIGGSVNAVGRCADSALKMDDHTRYMDELETLFEEGELVAGVCGQALMLKSGEVAPLGINLIDSMKAGTAEFWFHPGEDFYDAPARTLLGNDESRLHFFYKDGELVFQKNHADIHYYAKGKAELRNGWNLIAGQWGDGYLSVWLNGKLVSKIVHEAGYAPSLRDKPFGNLLVIGYKSYCCMEGPGQYTAMTTSGAFDQFRISSIPRYKVEDAVKDDTFPQDTVWFADTLRCCYDTVAVDTVADTLIVVVSDTTITDTTITDTTITDTTVTDTTITDTTVTDTTVTDTTVADTVISFETAFDGGVIYIDTTGMIPILRRDSL